MMAKLKIHKIMGKIDPFNACSSVKAKSKQSLKNLIQTRKEQKLEKDCLLIPLKYSH